MYDYEKTCQRFLEVNCQITDTKEEYEERNKGTKFSKLIQKRQVIMNG